MNLAEKKIHFTGVEAEVLPNATVDRVGETVLSWCFADRLARLNALFLDPWFVLYNCGGRAFRFVNLLRLTTGA